jgi:hypothetical protein
MKCEICEREFETLLGISNHIARTHKDEIMLEEYYLKFIGEKGKCGVCGKDTTFRNLGYGYNKFCSLKCSNNSIDVKNKKKKTCFENSGFEYPSQNPITKEKQKQTCFENSGYAHALQNPKSKEKKNQTCLKKFGYEHSMQNPKSKEKKKQTCFENSGYAHALQNPKSRKKTKSNIIKK